LLLITAACSNSEKSAQGENNSNEKKEENLQVDKGLLNVEITLPASFFEGEDIDQVIADAKADGIKEATKNSDGSVTYKMTKSKHKELMSELEEGLVESLEEMKNGSDFPSIKEITYNKSFTEYTLIVDKEAYENSFDAFATMGLGMTGAYYQIFNGEDPDEYQVKITVKDEATGENISEVIYPDVLDELEEANQESAE